MNKNKLLLYPMKTTVLYLLFTIVLFVYGPIKWKVPTYNKLVSFLLVYIASFVLGYCFQLRRKKYSSQELINTLSDPDCSCFGLLGGTSVEHITFIFVLSSVYSIFKHIILTTHYYGSLDFSAFLNIDLAASYFDRLSSDVQGTWYIQLLNYTSVLDAFWFILGVLYFKRLKFPYKCLFFAAIIFSSLYNVMSGTMISWAILVFRLIPLLFVGLYKSGHSKNIKTKRKSKKTLIFIILVCVIFVVLFSSVQESRSEYVGKDLEYDAGVLSRFIKEEYDIPVIGSMLRSVDFYLVNGYCGMAYGLELEPKFTYGIGFSRDFARLINQTFGFDVSAYTYPQRIEDEYGWLNGKYWPSAFTWFASDWTFYGIPILMFIFGAFLCNVWYSALYENSIVATALSSWLWIGIIFLPANNQLFQSLSSFMTTVCLIILYQMRKLLPRIVF